MRSAGCVVAKVEAIVSERLEFRARQDARRRRRDTRPNTNAGLGLVVTSRAEGGCFTPKAVAPTP